MFLFFHLLVVEHDVWPPDVIGGHVEHIHSTVLFGVPAHLVIVPELLHPQIGGHNLIAEVHINELREFQLETNRDGIRHVHHRTD